MHAVEMVRLEVFRTGVALVALVAVLSAALLPTREGVAGAHVAVAAAVAGVTVAACALVFARPERYYRALSDNPVAQWVLALIAAAQISAVLPLHSQLWVPACALLALLGTMVSLSRTLLFCGVALCANLLAHVLVGDLPMTPFYVVFGLWEGLPLWTTLFSVVMTRFVRYLCDIYIERVSPPAFALVPVAGSIAREHLQLPRPPVEAVSQRMTVREIQVFALLMCGQRPGEIAKTLGIKPERISHLIEHAVDRANAGNKNILIGKLALEWWGTGPTSRLSVYLPG
ncbi:MAG TPA: helix-turn-helix transcriptional regulator [Solirubrobacteraceae bacterium]|nr:helix-turn-helix transcriptional regulator [Solirubrobacteraceae bacterium]